MLAHYDASSKAQKTEWCEWVQANTALEVFPSLHRLAFIMWRTMSTFVPQLSNAYVASKLLNEVPQTTISARRFQLSVGIELRFSSCQP